MIKWIDNFLRKRRTKKFIQDFIDNNEESIIIKQWEHCGWGDAIYANEQGLYGHLSGLRRRSFGFVLHCDLHDRDVIVLEIEPSQRHLADGKKYDIGLFFDVRVQSDPPDMFFAKYLRLGFANNYSRDTIIELAKQRIKNI